MRNGGDDVEHMFDKLCDCAPMPATSSSGQALRFPIGTSHSTISQLRTTSGVLEDLLLTQPLYLVHGVACFDKHLGRMLTECRRSPLVVARRARHAQRRRHGAD